ncbi:unnamed protein product, partial [Didymodactylos carnosus]
YHIPSQMPPPYISGPHSQSIRPNHDPQTIMSNQGNHLTLQQHQSIPSQTVTSQSSISSSTNTGQTLLSSSSHELNGINAQKRERKPLLIRDPATNASIFNESQQSSSIAPSIHPSTSLLNDSENHPLSLQSTIDNTTFSTDKQRQIRSDFAQGVANVIAQVPISDKLHNPPG